MDEIERSVSDGVIEGLVDVLRVEADPRNRELITRLLVREESRFGAAQERLDMVERHLAEDVQHIAVQTRFVAEMRRRGRDVRVAESILKTSHLVQRLFEELRVLIREEAAESS